MNEYYLFLMALPLLLVDWQIAIIWVLAVASPSVSSELLLMDYEGLEVFFLFVAVGSFRRFIIGRL